MMVTQYAVLCPSPAEAAILMNYIKKQEKHYNEYQCEVKNETIVAFTFVESETDYRNVINKHKDIYDFIKHSFPHCEILFQNEEIVDTETFSTNDVEKKYFKEEYGISAYSTEHFEQLLEFYNSQEDMIDFFNKEFNQNCYTFEEFRKKAHEITWDDSEDFFLFYKIRYSSKDQYLDN